MDTERHPPTTAATAGRSTGDPGTTSTVAPGDGRPDVDAHLSHGGPAMVDAWIAALEAGRDYVPVSRTALRDLVAGLTARLVSSVRATPVDVEVARAVGLALVDARIASADALDRSLTAVADHLLDAAGDASIPDGARRLHRVLGALGAGWLEAVRDETFAAQEAIRAAEVEARNAVEQRLRASEARFRAVFAESAIGIVLADVDGRILKANAAFSAMLGHSREEVGGRRLGECVGILDTGEFRERHRELLSGAREHVQLEVPHAAVGVGTVWMNLTVSIIRDAEGDPQYTLVMAEDVSEQRSLRERLRHQALHDPLTGLANRVLFFERLAEAIDTGEGRVGVCALDLDGFKSINDTLGHDIGDRLLVAVASRLERAVAGEGHLLARMGGDEFVVLVAPSRGVARVRELAVAALDAVAVPFAVAGHQLRLTASAGIVERPVAGTTPTELTKAADLTLYRAKREGAGRCEVFDAERSRWEADRLRLAATLPSALERDEFVVEYQPIVDLHSGAVRGVEALVRWMHPQLGRVAPDRFVDIAEETGAIVRLGRMVLERACDRVGRWRADVPDAELFVSVNLAVRQMREAAIVGDILGVLERHDLPPRALLLELTESALLGPTGRPLAALHELDAAGVRIAIDDFGTGYSNLAYLHTLPVRILKLDGGFVQRPTAPVRSDSATAITESLVQLAHRLDMAVIAEGVETEEQAEWLHALRCDLAQGWHFARAMPAEDIGRLLRSPPLPVTPAGVPLGRPPR